MGTLIVTRSDFQELAEVRLAEARALLDLERWDGAYYLAGYSVELALKACIIKMLMQTDAFPDKDFSRSCYTHSIDRLVAVARLEDPRGAAMDGDPDLQANWAVVRDWSEVTRYQRVASAEAENLYKAIVDAELGVLPWIKTYW